MEHSRAKLRLALWILIPGMLVALVWHGWQGWGLHRGYPHNTFLYPAKVRHSDFSDSISYLKGGKPYELFGGQKNYFPANYVLFEGLAMLPLHHRFLIFVVLVEAGLFWLMMASLRALVPHAGARLAACLPFLLSYPNLSGIDRGNGELLLAFLVALSLWWFQQRRYGLSWAALLLPVGFKFYPIVLGLLFLRRRLVHWFVLMPLAFGVITGLSLLTFREPIAASLHAFSFQLATYTVRYNLDQDGVSADASAWNLTRIGVWALWSSGRGSFHWTMPFALRVQMLEVYTSAMLVLGFVLALHVVITEKSWPRRAVLLLLYLVVSAPGGGSYKLMHVVTALVVYILVRERHRFDLAVTALLAMAVLPKREVILHFVGPSDTQFRDAGFGVLVNPVCLLLAMFLMAWAAYTGSAPLSWRQQVAKLTSILHLS